MQRVTHTSLVNRRAYYTQPATLIPHAWKNHISIVLVHWYWKWNAYLLPIYIVDDALLATSGIVRTSYVFLVGVWGLRKHGETTCHAHTQEHMYAHTRTCIHTRTGTHVCTHKNMYAHTRNPPINEAVSEALWLIKLPACLIQIIRNRIKHVLLRTTSPITAYIKEAVPTL